MWAPLVFLNYKEKKKEEKKISERGKDLGTERGGAKQREGEMNQYTMKHPSVGVCENNDKEIRREKQGKQM